MLFLGLIDGVVLAVYKLADRCLEGNDPSDGLFPLFNCRGLQAALH